MKKKLLIVFVVLLVLGGAAGVYVWKYVYNKPHPDYITMPADFVVAADALFGEFVAGSADAEKRYNGKVVEISGMVSALETADSLVVAVFVFRQGDFGDEGIRCAMDARAAESVQQLNPGQQVRIKGYLTGYNGTDVILEKCSVVN